MLKQKMKTPDYYITHLLLLKKRFDAEKQSLIEYYKRTGENEYIEESVAYLKQEYAPEFNVIKRTGLESLKYYCAEKNFSYEVFKKINMNL